LRPFTRRSHLKPIDFSQGFGFENLIPLHKLIKVCELVLRMTLRETPLLFLDCQTTGMHPSTGALLEIAWGFGKASQTELDRTHSEIISLPEGEKIPAAVRNLTGLTEQDLELSLPRSRVFQDFQTSLQENNFSGLAVIHYGQFEKAFLEKFFETETGSKALPFEIFCTQKLAHRLFPQFPSRNIRGLAGRFSPDLGELKRARSHVQATFEVWRQSVSELEKLGITTQAELTQWLEATPKRPKANYEYQIPKELRLKLPKKPGVYFMKAASGKILYVGKATSLRDRVNSYFRGKKGRDTKKLEMLTQVSELDFVETGSALEAALLESDEIKRLDPPYNISLKTGTRNLIYFSKDFLEASSVQDQLHPLGPFRPNGSVEQMLQIRNSILADHFTQLFYEEFRPELLKEAFLLFCARHKLEPSRFLRLRTQMALGSWLLRQFEKEAAEAAETETSEEEILAELEAELESETETEPTPEELSEKFDRVLARGAWELRRSRQLTALLNCHLEWESELGWRSLEIRGGKLQSNSEELDTSFPWTGLTIADFDRMSIIQSEIARREHHLQKL
jgi:DNA polymerase III subunit epsilon